MAWPKKQPGIGNIMANWKAAQPASPKMSAPMAPSMPPKNPKQRVAVVLAEKAKQSGGVPGLMATRNNLANMRRDTMPKGHKYGK